ncbi:hypothetical protein O3M35_000645 [Rhynocoris fuscipes]|uniref:Uncharacterized protein n=1 Tax=Rhynocoris fuscipes TaxID=488301 RepID=A0AAW1DPG7_9HEMI
MNSEEPRVYAVTQYTNFNGTAFYEKYSKSSFLKSSKGTKFIHQVLSSAIQFKCILTDKESITLKGIKINDKDDLVIKRGSNKNIIMDFDFTLNRLQGFCAAFACTNPNRFNNNNNNTVLAMAASMGYELKPDSTEDFRKFYFSFAPGSQQFSCILGFWPIVSLLILISEQKKKMINIHAFLRKFKVKSDAKKKLMYQIKNRDAIARIIPVVSKRELGEKIDFSDCLKSFSKHLIN